MNIIHYTGCWPSNIGNAFIDYGAREITKQLFPSADIHFISSWNGYFGDYSKYTILKNTNIDILIISGCCLANNDIRNIYIPLINELRQENKNMKVYLLGAGMWNYDLDSKLLPELLKELNPDIFISRDTQSYQIAYNLKNIYDGIDCGFFISDHYKPLNLRKKYITYVETLEQSLPQYPDIFNIISVNHVLNEHQKNEFVSDHIYDYINIYANSEIVISNRVHACVVSCAYGVKNTYVGNSDRAHLFNSIGLDYAKPMNPNLDIIKEKKYNMVKYIKEHI